MYFRELSEYEVTLENPNVIFHPKLAIYCYLKGSQDLLGKKTFIMQILIGQVKMTIWKNS